MSQPPIKYVTKLDYYDSRWNYLCIPLPREIEKFDELEPELKKIHKVHRENLDAKEDVDKKKALFPKLITPEETSKADPVFLNLTSEEANDNPNYIRIDFERNGRHGLVIKSKGTSGNIPDKDKKERYLNKNWLIEDISYYMRIPVEFTKHNENSPLHGFEDESCVILEVDQENTEMRIYSPEGYRSRDEELKRKGRKPIPKTLSYTGLPLSLMNIYADSSGIGTQKFRIVPFNAQHSLFRDSGEGFDFETNQPDPALFQKVVRKNRVPRYKAQTLKVYWDPDGMGYGMHSRKNLVYNDMFVEEAEITLPAEGSFEIVTETWYGEQKTVLFHGEGFLNQEPWESKDIGDWTGKYIEGNSREDCITVYAPCKTTSQSSRLLSKIREYFSM